MKIKELPSSERPYEKLEMYGANYLSNAELLAIIIKTGTKDKTAVELAQQIIKLNENKENESLIALYNLSIEEFMSVKGIGKVKAIQLKAVFELAKRIARPTNRLKIKIKNSDDAAKVLMEEMRHEPREIVKIIILNNKNQIIKIKDISIGNSNNVTIDIKEILVENIKIGAPKIILAHNHPSGDCTPSKKDIETTKNIINVAQMMGIQLLDHIVIGDGTYTSIMSKLIKIG